MPDWISVNWQRLAFRPFVQGDGTLIFPNIR
jgi:hypothetical protein